jgi:hypothetical protein
MKRWQLTLALALLALGGVAVAGTVPAIGLGAALVRPTPPPPAAVAPRPPVAPEAVATLAEPCRALVGLAVAPYVLVRIGEDDQYDRCPEQSRPCERLTPLGREADPPIVLQPRSVEGNRMPPLNLAR